MKAKISKLPILEIAKAVKYFEGSKHQQMYIDALELKKQLIKGKCKSFHEVKFIYEMMDNEITSKNISYTDSAIRVFMGENSFRGNYTTTANFMRALRCGYNEVEARYYANRKKLE